MLSFWLVPSLRFVIPEAAKRQSGIHPFAAEFHADEWIPDATLRAAPE